MTISILNNGTTVYPAIPVLVSTNNAQLYNQGYILSTGLDTNVQEGASDSVYMVDTVLTGIATGGFATGQQRSYFYRMGNAPPQTSFPVIVGYGGNVTVADSPTLELGNNFTYSTTGYIDTSFTTSTSNLSDILNVGMLYYNDLAAWNATALIDGNTGSQAFHTDTADPGAYVAANFSYRVGLTIWRYYASGVGVDAVWDIQFSDNATTWTTAYTGLNMTGTAGWHTATWADAGEHQYWRSLKTDAAVAGDFHNELDISGYVINKNLIDKDGAFSVFTSNSSEISVEVNDSRALNATGISSGVHTVTVETGPIYMDLYVDGTSVSLLGEKVPSSFSLDTEWSDVFASTPASPHRPHVQGVAIDGIYIYASSDVEIKKTYLSSPDWDSPLVSNNHCNTDGTDISPSQINGLFIEGDYIYTTCFQMSNPDNNITYIKRFNKTTLVFVDEWLIQNGSPEGCTHYGGYWWVIHYGGARISQYSEAWVFQQDFPLIGEQNQGSFWVGDDIWIQRGTGDEYSYKIYIYHWDGVSLDLQRVVDNPMGNQGLYQEGNHLWTGFFHYIGAAGHNDIVKLDIGYYSGGSSVSTLYPDAHSENTTVDGFVKRYVAAGGTWADIRDGAGTEALDSTTTGSLAYLKADTDVNEWTNLQRGIFLFDTDLIPSGANITSATVSFYGMGKSDTLGASPTLCVYSAATSSNTSLVMGDYDTLGTVPFSNNITYASYNITGYNVFTLNPAGIAAINRKGITKFSTRESTYDVANNPPGWVSGASYQFASYFAEEGTVYRPKLEVTYTVGEPISGVLDNDNSYKLMQRNSMVYASNTTISINGTQQLWFQPVIMPTDTALPDRSGNGHNGVIAWGTNPPGIEVTMGAITSSSASTYGGGEGEEVLPIVVVMPDVPLYENTTERTDMPQYALMKPAADALGWTTNTLYGYFMIGTAAVMFIAGLVATSVPIIATGIALALLGMAGSTGIIAPIIVAAIAILVIALIVIVKRN